MRTKNGGGEGGQAESVEGQRGGERSRMVTYRRVQGSRRTRGKREREKKKEEKKEQEAGHAKGQQKGGEETRRGND